MIVVFDEDARADLDHIDDDIAQDKPSSASSVVARIIDAAELLGTFPRLGHPGRAPGTLEKGVRGSPYIIVYQVSTETDQVTVTGVFHGARQHRRLRARDGCNRTYSCQLGSRGYPPEAKVVLGR